jgi:hypothetical protein
VQRTEDVVEVKSAEDVEVSKEQSCLKNRYEREFDPVENVLLIFTVEKLLAQVEMPLRGLLYAAKEVRCEQFELII